MATDDPGAAFKRVGGTLCLDLVNTVSGRLPQPRPDGRDYHDAVEKERLVTYDDLARWATTVGLLTAVERRAIDRAARARPEEAASVVVRARALREAIYRACVAAMAHWEPPRRDLALLNQEISRAREHQVLVSQSGSFAWESQAPTDALDRILWPVARSAAELLTSEELGQVRRCGGEDCAWLFLDTSRNRSRRWCDMAECGNRAKVRRFRQRRPV